MTEKRYFLGYEDDFFRWVNDSILKKNYVIKIGFDESDDLQEIVDLLNEKEKRIEYLEHQLYSLSGLWASDKEDMIYPFRLEFKEVNK